MSKNRKIMSELKVLEAGIQNISTSIKAEAKHMTTAYNNILSELSKGGLGKETEADYKELQQVVKKIELLGVQIATIFTVIK